MSGYILSLIQSASDFRQLFQNLSEAQRMTAYDSMKDRIEPLIHSTPDFFDIFYYLSETQRMALCESVGDRLPIFIPSTPDFFKLLANLSQPDRLMAYEIMKKHRPTLIDSVSDLCEMQQCLSKAQWVIFFEIMKDRLPTMIQSRDHLVSVFNSLSMTMPMHCCEILKHHIQTFIQSVPDLMTLLNRTFFHMKLLLFNAIESSLSGLIRSPSDFLYVLGNLSSSQRATLCHEMGEKLTIFPDWSCDILGRLLTYLTINESQIILKAKNITQSIQSASDFTSVLMNLSKSHRTVVLDAMIGRLPPIKTSGEMILLRQYLTHDQCLLMTSTQAQAALKNVDLIEMNRNLISHILINTELESMFFIQYNALYQQARNGFFGYFRKTTCSQKWTLNDILNDPKKSSWNLLK